MFLWTSCENGDWFRKLGVQRITEILSLVLGLWAFLPFSVWENPRRNKENTVTSGEGKQVLIRIIKRFKERGFRLYSISFNLMLELNSLEQAH